MPLGPLIYTGNDPISGEYYRAGAREIEKGYASYTGTGAGTGSDLSDLPWAQLNTREDKAAKTITLKFFIINLQNKNKLNSIERFFNKQDNLF